MSKLVERIVVFCVVFLILQLAYGLIKTPSALALKPIMAVVFVLALYVVLTFKSPISANKIKTSLLTISLTIGFIISFIYFAQIFSEYFITVTGKTDEMWGYIAFGGLPLWFGVAGGMSAYKTKSVRSGIVAAIWSAMISSLLWINILFLAYFIFFNTPQQFAVLKAGETIADFQRSGMKSLDAFVIQDYMGATFFHLLLSIVIAMIFGSMGALIGKFFAHKVKRAF